MPAKTSVRNSTALFVILIAFTTGYLNPEVPYLPLVRTVSASALAQRNEQAIIMSTDISPDASRLAILYGAARQSTSSPVYRDLWIALWDLRANTLLNRTLLATSEQVSDVFIGPSDVRFSPNGKAIVTLGLGRVWVLDISVSSTQDAIRSPAFQSPGIPTEILQVSNSEMCIVYAVDEQSFHVVRFDSDSDREIANWSSTAAPQSFSTNAKSVAETDLSTYNKGGVSNIAISNAETGRLLRSVRMGFTFPKLWLGKRNAHGAAIARFINTKELIAVPDGTRDSRGHHSGEEAEVINAMDGRIERTIPLEGYGPTGIVAESVDRAWLAMESVYAKPAWFSIESTDPSRFTHTLRLLKTDGSDSQFAVAWPTDSPLRDGLPVISVAPSISSAGPTVAITEGNTIKVFSASRF